MIVKIVQGQRKGKTAVMVAIALWLMAHGGYKPDEVCGNITLFIDGYKRFYNQQILQLLQLMVEKHIGGKVILISEADRVFPPRFWADKKQTHALIGVQQDEKLGNWLIYDTHWRGVDILLDSATQIEIIPQYRPESDCIDCEIIKLQDMIPHVSTTIKKVSECIFPYYDTHEPVH